MASPELKNKTEDLFIRIINAMIGMTDQELLRWRGLSSTMKCLSEHVHRNHMMEARDAAFTLIDDLVDQAENPEFEDQP